LGPRFFVRPNPDYWKKLSRTNIGWGGWRRHVSTLN
jgi:hypothetical protein